MLYTITKHQSDIVQGFRNYQFKDSLIYYYRPFCSYYRMIMIVAGLLALLTFSLLWTGSTLHPQKHPNDYRLPIVFTYTVVKAYCNQGLPGYVRAALQQSVFTQPDCITILLSNIGDCPKMIESIKDIQGLELIDSTILTSERTKQFENRSNELFYDNLNSLWMTSALRFYLLEDLMIYRNMKELIHFEIDNMLYGRLTTILPGLRKHYPLAATPLNHYVTFITASVFWVSSQKSINHFNNFLSDVAFNNNKTHDRYIDFLRPTSAKQGGMYPDSSGVGVKPFAINEMSMLSYYHYLYPKELKLFPVIPEYDFPVFPNQPYIPNITCFTPRGERVGPKISPAIWDSGSYGQYIGGTKEKNGKNKRFTDGSHIAGVGIRISKCEMVFYCHNMTEFDYGLPKQHHHSRKPHHRALNTSLLLQKAATSQLRRNEDGDNQKHRSLMNVDHKPSKGRCYTAPHVRCENDPHWTPLWNLHVHSKHTVDYLSEQCDCKKAGGNSSVSIYVNVEDWMWKPAKSPIV